jgi:hypothetical protein
VLRLVEIAARDIGVVLQAGDREQIVAVGRLPDVDEVAEIPAVVPEIAGADLETARGSVMRMACDAERVLAADFAENLVCPLVRADVGLDVQRDDV